MTSLGAIDLAIVAAYFVLTVAVRFALMRRANRNLEHHDFGWLEPHHPGDGRFAQFARAGVRLCRPRAVGIGQCARRRCDCDDRATPG